MTVVDTTRDYAEKLDREDELAPFRQEFYLKEGSIYMDGNSLGLMSKRSEQSLLAVLDSWRNFGIDGWTEGDEPWFDYAERLGAMMAPLVCPLQPQILIL